MKKETIKMVQELVAAGGGIEPDGKSLEERDSVMVNFFLDDKIVSQINYVISDEKIECWYERKEIYEFTLSIEKVLKRWSGVDDFFDSHISFEV